MVRSNRFQAWSLTALALLILSLPAGSGQSATFGTHVKTGDVDNFPTTRAASIAVRVNEWDYGDPDSARDNCILLDTASTHAAGAQVDDLRLTRCMGKLAGTRIAMSDPVEKAATWNQLPAAGAGAAIVQYADSNSNGKYDKGDYVYITTSAAGTLTAPMGNGVWSLRLTKAGDHAAGTLVHSGDKDFVSWQGSVKQLTSVSIAERDDKVFYLLPKAAAFPSGSIIPKDSIRLGGASFGEPLVRVTKIEIATPEIVAEKAFQVLVTVENAGKATGNGLVTSRLNGVLVGAHLTPTIPQGESTTMVVTLPAPAKGGAAALEVNELFQIIGVKAAPGGDTLDPEIAALLGTLARLEERIAVLEEAQQAASAAAVPVSAQGSAEKTTPGPAAVLLVGVFAGLAVFLRRRPEA